MKSVATKMIAAFVLLLATLPTGIGHAQATSSTEPGEMSEREVLRASSKALPYVFVGRDYTKGYYYVSGSVRIVPKAELGFSVKNEKGKVIYVRFDPQARYSSRCSATDCNIYIEGADAKWHQFYTRNDEDHKEYAVAFGSTMQPVGSKAITVCSEYENHAACMSSAKLFVAALNAMRTRAASTPAGAADFHQQAAAWRSLATKPPLAQGVRIHRLLAEEAVSQKQLDEALNRFELGVEADPTWATGWYNAALLASELGYFADAVQYMQNYLELVPDGENAQAARDSVDIWKYKAKH